MYLITSNLKKKNETLNFQSCFYAPVFCVLL
jgi:hypothetical protein